MPRSHPHTPDLLTPEAVAEETALLERALGGRRGVLDAAAPSVVFLVVYLLTEAVGPAAAWALGTGLVVAGWRLLRHQPLTQVAAGLAGVVVSAVVALRSSQAADFYLPGIAVNVVYGTVLLLSVLLGRPLLGYAVGLLVGDPTGWRRDPHRLRAYALATWLWVGLFGSRLLVQVPMYLASRGSDGTGWLAVLGTTKLVMGWPLFLFTAWLTYRVLAPVVRSRPGRSGPDG